MNLPVGYDEFRANPVIRHKAQSDTYDEVFGIMGFGGPDESGYWTRTFVNALSVLGQRGDTGRRVALAIPQGREFKVDLDYLPAPNLTQIIGAGTLVSTASPSTPLSSSGFFTGVRTTGFELRGVGFRADDDKAVALKLTACSDVLVEGCRLREARLVDTQSATTHSGYDTSANGNVCRDVVIANNRLKRTEAIVTGKGGILLFYTIGAAVTGNVIDGYGQGIQWWGGDAAHIMTFSDGVVSGGTNLHSDSATFEPVDVGGAITVAGVAKTIATFVGPHDITLDTAATNGSGITFSFASGDGALVHERKAGQMAITGNVVRNCPTDLAYPGSGGGIWGSMGRDVTVAGNVVYNVGDTALDSEGGMNITFTGNTVREAVNGIGAFFYNRNLTFVGNSVEIDHDGYTLGWVHNGYIDRENKDITFEGNTFWCSVGTGTIQLEPCEVMTFRNNTLRNVKILARFVNHRWTTIEGNTLIWDTAASAAFIAIDAGLNALNAKLTIRDNTICTGVAQPAGSSAIYVDQFDPGSNPVTHIRGNIISGFTGNVIEVEWSGTNVSTQGVYFIRDNCLGGAGTSVLVTESGAAPSITTASGNYREDATLWP